MNKIVVQGLKYRYPLTKELALDDISFSVAKGEFIGIVGRNLAGKSTLCQALMGLVPHFYKGGYGGSVTVDGLKVEDTEISELARRVGLVFQNPFTQVSGSKMTVYEELAFGLENLGVPREAMAERIEHAMELLGIARFGKRNPFDLSGGQMQRMAIASVIAMQPDIIVLDEPTSQLDPQGSEEVFQAIQALSRQGMTVLMVEHKMEKIARYSDRVLLLDHGKLIDFDTPERVFSRPDLANFGIAPPVFAQICQGLGVRDAQTGLYPMTLDDAYDQVVSTHA